MYQWWYHLPVNYNIWIVSLIEIISGQVRNNISFEYEDKALAHAACSFKLNDEYWVAGGLGAGMSKFQVST